MRQPLYLIWLLSGHALASSWSSWLPWGSRPAVSSTPTQPSAPRAPSFRSIRDLDYSGERSYNEDIASWKDDEEDEVISQVESEMVFGKDEDETAVGHDDETTLSNMARSEETSVSETFSDQEDEDSIFGISSKDVDILFGTEETKDENTVSEVSSVTEGVGTTLGIGAPTQALKPKKNAKKSTKKSNKKKKQQPKAPEEPPKQLNDSKKSPRGIDASSETRPTRRGRKTMNKPKRKQVRPVVEKQAVEFSLEQKTDAIGTEMAFESESGPIEPESIAISNSESVPEATTFYTEDLPVKEIKDEGEVKASEEPREHFEVESEMKALEEPLETDGEMPSVMGEPEAAIESTTSSVIITEEIITGSEDINELNEMFVESTVIKAVDDEEAPTITEDGQAEANARSISYIFEPYSAIDSTVGIDSSAPSGFLTVDKKELEDFDEVDGLEALIERIERQAEGQAHRKNRPGSFFGIDTDDIFDTTDGTEIIATTKDKIKAVIPYDLKDLEMGESGSEGRMVFQPRPIPTNADVLDDPFGIHLPSILRQNRIPPDEICPNTEDDGLADCSGCLFPSGWSPVHMRRPSAFSQWHASRQRQRAHEQQRGLLTDADKHPIRRIEQQRRGSAADSGKDAASPSPSDAGHGHGGGRIERRARGSDLLSTTNGSALDMLLRQFRDGRRAVYRPDEDESAGPGLGEELQASIQQQREQHRQGAGTRVQEARPSLNEASPALKETGTAAPEQTSLLGGIRQRFNSMLNSSSSSSSEGTIAKAKRSITNFFASSSSSKEEESSGLFPGLSLFFTRLTSTSAPVIPPTQTQSRTQSEQQSVSKGSK